MAIKEIPEIYDEFLYGVGEIPSDNTPAVIHLTAVGVKGNNGLEERLETPIISETIDKLHKNERGMIIRGLANKIEIHVFRNRRLAEATLTALGVTAAAAGIFLLSKTESGKWTLGHILHSHIGNDKK